MFFATQLQQLEYVRAQFRAQDEAGVIPAATVNETASADEKRAALLAGTYRPPCGCDPANGPTPCDAAILAVLVPGTHHRMPEHRHQGVLSAGYSPWAHQCSSRWHPGSYQLDRRTGGYAVGQRPVRQG